LKPGIPTANTPVRTDAGNGKLMQLGAHDADYDGKLMQLGAHDADYDVGVAQDPADQTTFTELACDEIDKTKSQLHKLGYKSTTDIPNHRASVISPLGGG